MSRPRPETSLDLQGCFCDALGMRPDAVERYFEFVDWPDKLGARFKRYLPTGFRELAALVRGWGGEYDRDRRQFTIPKVAPKVPEAAKEAPIPAPSQGTMGYYVITPGYYPQFPIDKILSSKFSFRLNIKEGIDDLMSEIHAAGRIIEPLICRSSRKPGHVEVGPGERRLLAAKNLAMKTVPIIVDNFTDQEFDRIRLLENIARRDLTDYEMARVLDHMLKTYPDDYPTQKALADEFGKTEAWISYHLTHKDFVEKELRPRGIDPASVTEGQTRAIRELPPDKREEILTAVKTTHRVPSWTEIKSFVHPEAEKEVPPAVPEEMPEIGKEAEIGEISKGSVGQPSAVGFEPSKPPVEGRRAEAPPSQPAVEISPQQGEIPETKPDEEGKPRPLLTGFKIRCPECHVELLIDHREFPNGKIDHKIKELSAN